MGVHNEGLHYANSRAVDLYLITLTGRSFIWISHPRECACSAYAEVVFTAFLQGRRNVFFPSFFLLLLLSPFSSMFSAFSIDILSRVRINCYLIITRDYYFSFLFLENKKKSSFLPWRKINTRFGSRELGSRRDLCAHRSTSSWGCCRAITICHDTSTWPVLRVALRLLIGGKDF